MVGLRHSELHFFFSEETIAQHQTNYKLRSALQQGVLSRRGEADSLIVYRRSFVQGA